MTLFTILQAKQQLLPVLLPRSLWIKAFSGYSRLFFFFLLKFSLLVSPPHWFRHLDFKRYIHIYGMDTISTCIGRCLITWLVEIPHWNPCHSSQQFSFSVCLNKSTLISYGNNHYCESAYWKEGLFFYLQPDWIIDSHLNSKERNQNILANQKAWFEWMNEPTSLSCAIVVYFRYGQATPYLCWPFGLIKVLHLLLHSTTLFISRCKFLSF